MTRTRGQILASILKGLGMAIAVTLALMAAVAAMAVFLRISDNTLRALNQVIKLSSLLAGTLVAVGRGGERGFLTGMTLAMLYMALGYGCYVALGGSAFDTAEMLGEILVGGAIGAAWGAVLSNLPARRRRRAA